MFTGESVERAFKNRGIISICNFITLYNVKPNEGLCDVSYKIIQQLYKSNNHTSNFNNDKIS